MAFSRFGVLVKFVIDRGKNLDIFAFLVWTIWCRRNLLRTSNTPYPITQVLRNAICCPCRCHQVQPIDPPDLTPRVSSRIEWVPPPHLIFKVNFDRAIFKEENKAGIGVVIRDDSGQVIASIFEKTSLLSSVDEVEALAVVRVLIFAQEVNIFSLSLKVIERKLLVIL